MPLLVDIAWSNADAAAAVEILAFPGSDHAGTIGAAETGLFALQHAFNRDHVIDRDAFGDANDQLEPGVGSFQDGVRGEGRGNKNRRRVRARLADRFGDSIKDRHFVSNCWPPLPGVTPATTWVP